MICINCGREQSDGKFCVECGLAFPVDIREKEGAIARKDSNGTLAELKCPQCDIATTEAFCPSCGIRVRPVPREDERNGSSARDGSVICPSCKTRSDRSICPQCGIRLSTGSL
jgi:hypothetical protein